MGNRLTCLLVTIVVALLGSPAMGQTEAVPTDGEPAAAGQPSVATESAPELARPTKWGEPTEVRIAIYVVDVDEIDTSAQRFAASIYYQAEWNIPVLASERTEPIHQAWTQVWTPRLTIVNQQQIWRSYPESVEIRPNGDVIYRQKVWGWFSQPLNLRDFPLDRQTLKIHIVAAGLPSTVVKIVPLMTGEVETSGISEQFSLPDFRVVSWKAEPRPYYISDARIGPAGFQMSIEVERSVTYYLIKIIIPLCLIVIMSWAPRWIALSEAGTSLGISATAFLTLVAYLFGIAVLLPPVSYITRIDRFVLLATILVFLGLIHTVLGIALIRVGKARTAELLNDWSKVIYPVFLALILLASFGNFQFSGEAEPAGQTSTAEGTGG